jgi:hypothetical protein
MSKIWSKLYIGLHVKYPLFLSDIKGTWKILKCKIWWKSVKWELSCFMWVDRRTDMTRLIVTLWNFVNVPKNGNIFGVTSRNKFCYERRWQGKRWDKGCCSSCWQFKKKRILELHSFTKCTWQWSYQHSQGTSSQRSHEHKQLIGNRKPFQNCIYRIFITIDAKNGWY